MINLRNSNNKNTFYENYCILLMFYLTFCFAELVFRYEAKEECRLRGLPKDFDRCRREDSYSLGYIVC